MVEDRIKKIQKKISDLEKQKKELLNVSLTALDREFVKRQLERIEKEIAYWRSH